MANWVRLAMGAALVGLAGLMAGCDGPKISDDNIKYVGDIDTVKDYMADKERAPVVLLDPRPAVRYEKEHAKGTINVPINLLRAGDETLASAKTVIVIAGGFEDRIGDAAVKTMLALGYKNVYSLRGGIDTWKKNGGAVESGPDKRLAGQSGDGATTRPAGQANESLDIFVPEQGKPPNF